MSDRIIETTAELASAELQRRGLRPSDRVKITIVATEDLLDRARTNVRALVSAAGLTDADVDAMIDRARSEVATQLR